MGGIRFKWTKSPLTYQELIRVLILYFTSLALQINNSFTQLFVGGELNSTMRDLLKRTNSSKLSINNRKTIKCVILYT